MARHDGELIAAGEVAFDLGDLARAFAGASDSERAKRLAMARLLSATEGWKSAAAALDGAFARSLGAAGLTGEEQR
ncbi:hypothetical protein [Sphingomonas mesophila]|uniref:hypothetical protein n=1 Tax=Sphingomonas mesophila TaxID=2303576 RepID=UPI000E594796|nr:hypothetical protein [Sphingomonas mesophila]